MRLLLLEDDDVLGDALSGFLRCEGHHVDWFTRLDQVSGLADEPYDALLIDWQLPDGSGVAWVAALRRRGNTTPILVLSARDLLADRIVGLDSGADDYLVKPFAPEELAARVRALGRRVTALSGHRRRFGDVEIDFTARSARVAGVPADLTAREWALLEALARRAGRIVSKADLEALATGFAAETVSNSLEVHISHLRRKLGRELIETIRGMGYRIGG